MSPILLKFDSVVGETECHVLVYWSGSRDSVKEVSLQHDVPTGQTHNVDIRADITDQCGQISSYGLNFVKSASFKKHASRNWSISCVVVIG